jgi:alkylation response protein AidB-like acyl-CoA dehydrogenase
VRDVVTLRRDAPGAVAERALSVASSAVEGGVPDLAGAVRAAVAIGVWAPLPTAGDTASLWELLASLGALDLTVARVVEPHLDALAILAQARDAGPGRASTTEMARASGPGLWQVYAAEGAARLRATRQAQGPGETWQLDGVKPWCSLAEVADHALVTAWVDDDERALFAVDLHDPGVHSLAGTAETSGQSARWAARGLTDVRSTGLRLHDVPATPVGPPQWYLTRPGFAWGGAGVAAVWFGAAVALGRRLRDAATRRTPDQVALLHLGAVDTALARARAVLLQAAVAADDPVTTTVESVHLAGVARQVVADTVDEVLQRVSRALGPAPLTGEEDHARRVADLTVYVRQHHAERDLAAAGERVLGDTSGWQWW